MFRELNAPNIALENESFLICSDSHATTKALDEVLSLEKLRYNAFLGDSVGYGEKPNQSIRSLNQFDIGILGNHDEAILTKKLKKCSPDMKRSIKKHILEISSENKKILEKLVMKFTRKNYMFFHGTPTSNKEYLIANDHRIKEIFTKYENYDFFFGGHNHSPRLIRFNKKSKETEYLNVDRNEGNILVV